MQLQNSNYRVSITLSDFVDPKTICVSAYDAVYGMEEKSENDSDFVSKKCFLPATKSRKFFS